MSGLKSGLIVLLMASPFVLYGLWQARGLARARAFAPDLPADKGSPPKEQLEAYKVKAEKAVADARKLESLALQFRLPEPKDALTDPTAAALLKAIADRSAELTNLEKFLSNVDAPEFADSKLRQKYLDWQSGKKERDRVAREIDAWFLNALTGIDSPESAARAVQAFEALLSQYTADGRFADPARVAAWRVQCRVEVIKSLEAAAVEPYAKVLKLPLPLPAEGDSPDVKKALGAPRAIAQQARLLALELKQAEEARVTLPDRLLADVKAADRRAQEWAAREELLTLLADPDPLDDPAKALGWLKAVFALYARSQTEAQRAQIRQKVQQFSNAFIPAAAKLDPVVLVKDKPWPRASVTIIYASDAKEKVLSDHPNELNEFNFKERFRGLDNIHYNFGAQTTGTFDALQPTEPSRIARDFTQAREAVTTWSAEEITRGKKRCGGDGEAGKVEERKNRLLVLDKLVGLPSPGAKSRVEFTEKNSKIWARLTTLATAIEEYPALFQTSP